MARVLTNSTSLRVTIEASIGVLPGTPRWTIVEFDTIGAYGAIVTTTVRRPISQDRGRKKGTVTDLNSTVEYETDLTFDAFQLFAEGFMFAEYANAEFDLKDGTPNFIPPPATATGYAIDPATALLAGKVQWGAATLQTLVFAKGYGTAANNGLKVLIADLAPAGEEITVAGLSVETPPTNATLEVAGVRTDDVTMAVVAAGATTFTSAADVDWTTLGINVGQYVHVGSMDANGDVQNAYDDAGADDVYGYCRVTAITATVLTVDKLDVNLTGGPHVPETIDFMFGRFLRNVPVTADADDDRYLERTYQFEAGYPDLGGAGSDEYEYAIGNFINEWTFNLPLTDKSTTAFNFIGTNSDDIVVAGSRKTGASTARSPLRTTAYNTSTDIISISTDVVSLVSDVCFKSLTLTFLNNVSPEKCLGTLGAVFVNAGVFELNLEGQMLFTNKSIINAIKNNTTVTFAAILANEDGAIAIDMPELTLGGGAREFPVDQSVLVNITGASFTSSTYGYDVGLSLFPAVPGVLAA